MNTYREQMVTAIQDLIFCRHNIFDNIVNLAMKGELGHLDGAVDMGETYEFKMNNFRGLTDKNVNTLIEICDHFESKIMILMEENDIDYNEIDLNVKKFSPRCEKSPDFCAFKNITIFNINTTYESWE